MALSLKEKDIASLLSVLSEDATQTNSFEVLAANLHRNINKQDYFKVGTALVLMLQNQDLLPHVTQRLAAIYLLYEMYHTDPIAANPFASVFVHLLNPPNEHQSEEADVHWAIPKISAAERYFIAQFISSPSKDIFKKTPAQVLQSDVSNMQCLVWSLPGLAQGRPQQVYKGISRTAEAGSIHFLVNEVCEKSYDVSGLQLALAERQSEMPAASKAGIPCVFPDPEIKPTRSPSSNHVIKARDTSL